MIEKILYNTVPVKDISKSIKWYTEVLGFQFVWHSEEEKLAQVNLPSGQMLFLSEINDDTNANFTKNGVIRSVVGFQAKNIEQFYDHLKAHGVRVEKIVHDEIGGFKFLDFFDPNGNMFNVECDA
ncbi:VOC family protein [Lederbergia wuyishanensis]|uniref:Catechol 2,3-dioxygenase-like lactoylglutathione lyase family enzyme n=1 Tax=Lederbergia wuyishanensis TaxID=1347903 RepID=A0ABU0D832_9BACI|nr:VOC family protein [Lederbergia wuyishanensis]MCJ8009319.1 VOC family protein [Lederbergia wuyishanensis]MDQ0344547.1 catechol 2,3-dioxygenase-like lactoylglutathione lyase family enzyme [Lederbergia wuyishanensis]